MQPHGAPKRKQSSAALKSTSTNWLIDDARAEGHEPGDQQGFSRGWYFGLAFGSFVGATIASLYHLGR